MSRNLCTTSCYFCRAEVEQVGPARIGTKEDFGGYWEEYTGMIVCDAECPRCGAQYLGWMNEHTRVNRPIMHGYDHSRGTGEYIIDLSFRSSFNDEPDPSDLPIWRVDQFGERAGLIEPPEKMDYWTAYCAEGKEGQMAWLQRREEARKKLQP